MLRRRTRAARVRPVAADGRHPDAALPRGISGWGKCLNPRSLRATLVRDDRGASVERYDAARVAGPAFAFCFSPQSLYALATSCPWAARELLIFPLYRLKTAD